jgi:hypothetical protein
MPHHMEDLERRIPYSLEKTWSQIPGICPGGGMLKFRIDRYISMGAKCGIVKPATVLL